MSRRLVIGIMFAVSLFFVGCGTEGKQTITNDPVVPTAPAAEMTYQVKLETSKGDIIIDVYRDWSPLGADQFQKLVKSDFYDDCRFFRVLSGFMAQCGINGDPAVHAKAKQEIRDDPVVVSNKRSYVTFAKTGAPNSRSTQFFINYKDNSNLDQMGFSPFGRVSAGMKVVDALFSGYGEGAPSGPGPRQSPEVGRNYPNIVEDGNKYLNEKFPKLDYIIKATIVGESDTAPAVQAKGEPTPQAQEEPAVQAENDKQP